MSKRIQLFGPLFVLAVISSIGSPVLAAPLSGSRATTPAVRSGGSQTVGTIIADSQPSDQTAHSKIDKDARARLADPSADSADKKKVKRVQTGHSGGSANSAYLEINPDKE